MKTIIKLSLLLIAISFASCEKSVYDMYYFNNLTGEDITIYTPLYVDGGYIPKDAQMMDVLYLGFVTSDGKNKINKHREPSEVLCGNRGAIYVTFFYKGKYYRESSFKDNSILVKSAWRTEMDTEQLDNYVFDITEEYILSLPESDR